MQPPRGGKEILVIYKFGYPNHNDPLFPSEATVAPAILNFPELQNRVPGKKCDEWDWHRFEHLIECVNEVRDIFRAMQPANIDASAFQSFAQFISEQDRCGRFTWFRILPYREVEIHDEADPSDCDFHQPVGLYVPAGWGNTVLELVKKGVIFMTKTEGVWSMVMDWGERIGPAEANRPFSFSVIPVEEERWLIDELITLGFLTEDRVMELAKEASKAGIPTMTLIREKNIVRPEDILTAQAAHFGCSLVIISDIEVAKETIAMVPAVIARKYKVIPIESNDDELTVATANPAGFDTVDSLMHLLNKEIKVAIAMDTDLGAALQKYYPEEPPSAPPDDPTCQPVPA